MEFTESAVANMLRCQGDLDSPRDGRRLRQRMVDIVARVVNCQLAVYLTIDAGLRGALATVWPEGLPLPPFTAELLQMHRQVHPLALHLETHRAIRAWRLSDVDSDDRFRAHPLYRRIYAALPARHQMVIRLASPDGALHAVALARAGRDFDDLERRALELLWPAMIRHLRHAQRSRRLQGSAAPGSPRDGRGVVLLHSDLGVELCTEQARLWLADYFPQFRPRHAMALPPPVAEWVRQRLDSERIGRLTPISVREPLLQARGERYLSLDLVVDHAKGEHLLVLAEDMLAAPAASIASLGLTPRESEVLSWVAQGKSNPVIAQILGMSGRTVQKHLEHVFQKLGVESRTAATLRAWQASRYELLHRA